MPPSSPQPHTTSPSHDSPPRPFHSTRYSCSHSPTSTPRKSHLPLPVQQYPFHYPERTRRSQRHMRFLGVSPFREANIRLLQCLIAIQLFSGSFKYHQSCPRRRLLSTHRHHHPFPQRISSREWLQRGSSHHCRRKRPMRNHSLQSLCLH